MVWHHVGDLSGGPSRVIVSGFSQTAYAAGYLLFVRDGTLLALRFDSATATAMEVQKYLARQNLLKEKISPNNHKFYVSDVPDRFAPVAERFLGRRVDNIIRVDITKY